MSFCVTGIRPLFRFLFPFELRGGTWNLGGLAVLLEYLPAPDVPGSLLDREVLQIYRPWRLPKLHECGGLPFRKLCPELGCRRCVAAAIGIASSSLRKSIQGGLRLLLLQVNPGDKKTMGIGLTGKTGRIL
jgi:hypothetical protein